MDLLGIGGCASGAGKTRLACAVLARLEGWAAVKSSIHAAADRRFEIVRDRAVLAAPGSDTCRLLAAGASAVVWLRASAAAATAGLDAALASIGTVPGVVVEGNSVWRERFPERLIVVARAGVDEVKASARALLARADLAVVNRPHGVPRGLADAAADRLVSRFGARAVSVVDLAEAEDPGWKPVWALLATWSRP